MECKVILNPLFSLLFLQWNITRMECKVKLNAYPFLFSKGVEYNQNGM